METTTPIFTPDQRIRVFVSSTLQELEAERTAIKSAIRNMHLTPVMFEMGARPHAPRNLYRQYLAQSQIFIGVYWDKYGWVAPGENISGLEDEYNLSGNMPKLIYIKKSHGQRDERITQLLKRIQQDDQVSYTSFTHPEELTDLVLNDLAVMLSERFHLSMQPVQQPKAEITPAYSIPAIPNPIVGREKSIAEVTSWLKHPDIRLVTLTGPGGIGKSRLGIEVARRLQNTWPDGAAFVSLAPVRDHTHVPEAISFALGIKISGGNVLEGLKLFLQGKKFLLVLDNFEQVIDAASIIDDLLMAAPDLKILVTSRERLALTFEYVYTVGSLSAERIEGDFLDEDCADPPALCLFEQRAKAMQPSFRIQDDNRDIILAICKRLEGLPLAIELAAAQIQLFPPAALLRKLEKGLDVLKGNYRDIPDRQKTMRDTIAWSYDLLSPAEQKLFLQLSLYPAGSLLDAIEYMVGVDGEDPFALVASLMNKSLLMRQDEEFQARFQMLESVREFAVAKTKEEGVWEDMMQQQAAYYGCAIQGIKLQKNRIDQPVILKYLEREHANIRQTLDFLLERGQLSELTIIAWNLWLFWWVNAHTREGYSWLKRAWELYKQQPVKLDEYRFCVLASNTGFMSFLQGDLNLFRETIGQNMEMILRQPDDELVATTTLITGVVKTILRAYDEADQLLNISLDRFTKLGLTTGMSFVLSALGRNALYHKAQTEVAKEYYRQSLDMARKDHNDISAIVALCGFALSEVIGQGNDTAKYLKECIAMSRGLHFYEAISWAIEIAALAAYNDEQWSEAITLVSAADHLRRSIELPVWEDLQALILDRKDRIARILTPEQMQEAWKAGAVMSLEEILEFVTRGNNGEVGQIPTAA